MGVYLIETLDILKDYTNGMSVTEIAIKYKKYNTTIRRILKRNGRDTKTISETHSLVSSDLFINSTKESDYWLGFLAADGYVAKDRYRITLALQEQDRSHLEKYVKFLGGKPSINSYMHKEFKRLIYRVNFSSQQVHTTLGRLGVGPNKSKSLELTQMNWDIFRGLFDGDGCFVIPKHFSICSMSIKLIVQLAIFLKDQKIKFTVTGGDIYNINIHKALEIKKVIENMYKEADIYLTRKYDKCHAWLKDQEKQIP